MIQPLITAFWLHIRDCLLKGDEETRLWLDTGEEVSGFLWWCDTSGLDASYLRARLVALWDSRSGTDAS